jgi:methyl-accepting chemotaxis protein
MDIDKRLEALTQTVELLASMHGDTEKAITRLSTQANETEKQMTRLAKTMEEMATSSNRLENEMASRTGRLETAMATLADGMALLTRRTIDHSGRIEKLEDNQAH